MFRKRLVAKENVRCRDVDEQLEWYIDGRLSPATTAAFDAHLKDCTACRRLVQDEPHWLNQLQQSRWEPLTPAEATIIRQRLDGTLRRKTIVRNSRAMMQSALALVLVSLFAGLFVWWQQSEIQSSIVEPTPLAEDAEPVTILFAAYDWEMARYKELAESFTAANPDVRVELVSINDTLGLASLGSSDWPEDGNARLASAADVISHVNLREAVQQKVVLDLTPFLQQDGRIDPNDFYPGTLDAFRWDGGLWALPTNAALSLIFFNKDAFDAAHLAYPQPGWTWDDFLVAAQALTRREGGEVTQWGFVERESAALEIVQALAGPIVDETVNPAVARLADTAVQDAVIWYTDLFLRHEVSPLPPSPGSDDLSPQGLQLIEAGQAAMWPDFAASFVPRSQEANIGAVPFPVGRDNENTTPMRLSNNLSLSAGTNKPEAAWRWMVYLSEQVREDSAMALPVRRSVLEASNLLETLDLELAAAVAFALEHPQISTLPTPSVTVFRQAVTGILSGERTLAEALGRAQTQIDTDQAELSAALEEMDTADIVVAEPETRDAGSSGVTITFNPGAPLHMHVYRTLARQFHEVNPGIVVTLRESSTTDGPAQFADIAADADCFRWSPRLDDPENLDAILSLDPFFHGDPTTRKEDFFAVVLDDFTRNGQLWGMPDQVVVTVVEYNKALFDAANVPHPSMDWTTEEFLTAAVALTRGSGADKQYGFVAESFELQDLISFIERQGAQLVNESVDPPTFGFSDPATIEAVRWFGSLTTEHGVKPVFTTNIVTSMDTSHINERQGLIDSSRAAMWTASHSSGLIRLPSRGEQTIDPNVGTAPLPVGPSGERLGGYQAASGFFISAHTGAPQACWEWIKYLSENSSETLVDWFLPVLPARISAAESAAYASMMGQERATAYLTSINRATGPSLFDRFSSENNWLNRAYVWLAKAYDQILHDGIPVEEALAVAQETAEGYRACVIDRRAFTNAEEQEACLHEADPSLPDNFFGPVQVLMFPPRE
jgi:ABC-type glycerol-3-phosphate transport system substrate-binding protein